VPVPALEYASGCLEDGQPEAGEAHAVRFGYPLVVPLTEAQRLWVGANKVGQAVRQDAQDASVSIVKVDVIGR
jgi:hypothetical protein